MVDTARGFRSLSQAILQEISTVLSQTNPADVNHLLTELLSAHTIVLAGAGRVGLATRGFAMRLAHLGLRAHALGDATVPAIGPSDLLLVASGSGETQTIYDITVLAHQGRARIALITGNPRSRMGQLARTIVTIKAPSKTQHIPGLTSLQPMTTLNEQCLTIFFDTVVLLLMSRTGQTSDNLWTRHSNLE